MSTTTLHYIYDPLCGWCFGAAPLVREARRHLPVVAHGGGMMTGAQRQPVTSQLREYVITHDRRIARITHQPFGDAYFEGLLHDTDAIFDSAPPIAAMLAAEQLAGRGLDLLARLQQAHYVEGRRIAENSVLIAMAADIGLDAAAFAAALDAVSGAATASHISASRRLMNEVGAAGFPTFVLETDGQRELVDAGQFIGNPAGFGAWLAGRLPQTATAGTGSEFVCAPDSCQLPEKRA